MPTQNTNELQKKKESATRIKKIAVRFHYFFSFIFGNLSDDCINVYDPKNRILPYFYACTHHLLYLLNISFHQSQPVRFVCNILAAVLLLMLLFLFMLLFGKLTQQ